MNNIRHKSKHRDDLGFLCVFLCPPPPPRPFLIIADLLLLLLASVIVQIIYIFPPGMMFLVQITDFVTFVFIFSMSRTINIFIIPSFVASPAVLRFCHF